MSNRRVKNQVADQPRLWRGYWCALVCLLLLVAGCGGLTPPAGIPSPVSNLMTASNPDASGNVTLTGAPGAVLPGALVTAANASQGASASIRFLEGLFVGTAHAQSQDPDLISETIARIDGSFELTVQGEVGETLRITQTVDGEKSPPAEVTIQGTVVDLGVAARAAAVDDETSLAYVTGAQGNDGVIFSLDLSTDQPLTSLPDPIVTLTGLRDIGSVAVDEVSGMGLAVSQAQNALVVFGLDPTKPQSLFNTVNQPLAVDTFPLQGLAAVGVESAISSVSIHDSVDGSFECSFLIPKTSGSTSEGGHVRTPFVRIVGSDDAEIQIVALSQYSDGTWQLSRYTLPSCFVSPIPNGVILMPEGFEPGGMDVFDQSNQAIVSDSNNAQILVANFPTGKFTAIQVGSVPKGVEVDAANSRAFIVNSGDNSITLLNLLDMTTRRLVGVGLGPSQLVVDEVTNRGLLISDLDKTVVIVDLNLE